MSTNNTPPITDDDVRKTKEYAEALNKLNASLTGVNSALPSFVDGMDAGLKAIAGKLPEVVASVTRLNAQNRALAAEGKKPVSVLGELASSLFSWNSLISIGVTLLVTYGSTIVKWVGEMIKGETTLTALNKAIKDNKLILEAVNKARNDGEADAQKELTHLKLLYKATQDQTLSIKERQKAVMELQKDYPDYFKNLSAEDIMAGKAAASYKSLSEAIIAAARARAAEDMITKNSTRQLGDELKISELTKRRSNAEKELAEVTKSNKALNNMNVIGGSTLAAGTEARDTAGDAKISRLNEELARIGKDLFDLNGDIYILNKQNDALSKAVQTDVKKNGVKILTGLKDPETKPDNKPNISPKPPKYTYKKLEELEGSAAGFAEVLEHRQQEYEQEQALLDKQHAEKLISQEVYQQKSDELQKQYQKNIGRQIKEFNATELADLQHHIRDMFIIQRHDDIMANDEKTVKKAVLPGDKLAAEKKLIEDKYAYEIALAYGNAEKIKQLEEEKQVAMTEIAKKHEDERKAFALQTTQAVTEMAFSMLKDSIRSRTDAKLKELNEQKQLELNNTSLTGSQKQAIEAKYKKKEAEEKVKAFKAEQRASILQAVINGALAITKATSQTGVLAAFAIPAIIVSTALQVATIAKQKPPQYAQGGLHYQSDGRGALLSGYSRTDNTNAYLRSGEAVVVSEAMRNPWARNLVSAINVAYGGRDFSTVNPGRGYAIGGVFTDGGNANRYYNQPVTDAKELANTMAYQMINNFPPIYVDVKDVNNQQNILAQTVNRVNL